MTPPTHLPWLSYSGKVTTSPSYSMLFYHALNTTYTLTSSGLEPGLLRPQRSVLTTRRSRLNGTMWLNLSYKFRYQLNWLEPSRFSIAFAVCHVRWTMSTVFWSSLPMTQQKTLYEDMINHRSYIRNLSSCEIKAWKNSGQNRIWTRDLCDISAVLYQLSHLGAGHIVSS